ncbi:hypothetical protein BJV78DRAFT_1247112, partial [Lactifluus subvellereus]
MMEYYPKLVSWCRQTSGGEAPGAYERALRAQAPIPPIGAMRGSLLLPHYGSTPWWTATHSPWAHSRLRRSCRSPLAHHVSASDARTQFVPGRASHPRWSWQREGVCCVHFQVREQWWEMEAETSVIREERSGVCLPSCVVRPGPTLI